MASPDDPDATIDAPIDSDAPHDRHPVQRIELPVYRPRHRLAVVFWVAFVVAALVVGLVVFLLLA